MSRQSTARRQRPNRYLVIGLLLALSGKVAMCQDPANPDDRLDDGLAEVSGNVPIFVRMDAQLFQQSGDYEQFCADRDGADRRALRREVLDQLRQNADQSWTEIEALVRELVEDDAIRRLQRYWIVNGFACIASPEAIRRIAEHDGVSFVYRQRLPQVPLHERSTQPRTPTDGQREIYRDLLDNWADDSNEPLNLEGVEIPWNLRRVRADVAWREEEATGSGVVVALCDSGLLVTPSLVAALWRNPNEQLNGRDDDGNGYVDDLFGYDFGAQSWYALGDGPRMTHGSMCGGILAGRPHNESNLITGVAPRAKLMVLRGMGDLRAYEYALMEGADVMSMSFMWVGVDLGNYRGVYRLAHEHLAAAGVTAVGGAGNFSSASRRAQPEGLQIALPKDIPCVIAAAGIVQDGSLARPSSRGPCYWDNVRFYSDYPRDRPLDKPDVTGCFGGFPVWGRGIAAERVPQFRVHSREPDGNVLMIGPQGNSFSGPHAGGVAALMLSVNPALPAWEVKRRMEATCRDLGPEGHDRQFGAGLLDAAAAVRSAREYQARP